MQAAELSQAHGKCLESRLRIPQRSHMSYLSRGVGWEVAAASPSPWLCWPLAAM